MWTSERITTLQKENEESKKSSQENAAKIELHQRTIFELGERSGEMQRTITEIAGHVAQHAHFNRSMKTTVTGPLEEVEMQHGSFQEVALVLQSHEQHLARNGAVSEKTQYINELNKDDENKRLWIGALMNEADHGQMCLNNTTLLNRSLPRCSSG